jgi:DNA-binding phage protein
MALTTDYRETIVARIQREPAFASALLDEATSLLLNGEAEAARLLLRDLVHGLLGFEGLARATGIPSKSLHRMLAKRGNPGMNALSSILAELVKAAFHAPADAHVRAGADALAA